jgi:hypothetical protein
VLQGVPKGNRFDTVISLVRVEPPRSKGPCSLPGVRAFVVSGHHADPQGAICS